MKKYFLLICGLFLASFIFPVSVHAKSFYFPRVQTQITVNTDGSINLVEERTFSFSGSFSEFYWDIPLKSGEDIDNVTLTEKMDNKLIQSSGLSFNVSKIRDNVHIQAYRSIYSEDLTFVLSYRMTGVVKKYLDVGQLYYQVIGGGWGARTDRVEVDVLLSKAVDPSELFVWGHGPLNGSSAIVNGQHLHFEAKDVPSNTFVEIRALFPSNLITGQPIAQTMLDDIKKEEKDFQNATKTREVSRFLTMIMLLAGIVTWILFWVRKWSKEGKEYRDVPIPQEIPFPPDTNMSPSLVENLVTQEQDLTPNSFSATILWLAKKGCIKIESRPYSTWGFFGIWSKQAYKYTLHFTGKSTGGQKDITQGDELVLGFLMSFSKNGTTLFMDDLTDGMKKDKLKVQEFFKDWKEHVEEEADKEEFVEDTSKKWYWIFNISNMIFWTVVIIICIILFQIHIPINRGTFLIFFVLWVIIERIGKGFLRWTKKYSDKAQQWISFKKYLQNISRIKRELPQAVIIWEDILIYGTALGVATTVAKYLPLLLSHVSTYPYWYVSSSSGGITGVTGLDTGFVTSFSQSITSMNSAFQSSFSSGSGGGFSGGGGGGSGGGGGGAR